MIYLLFAGLFPFVMNYILDVITERNKKANYKKVKMVTLFFAMLPMLLLFSLKSKYMGSDTSGYINKFLTINNYSIRDIFVTDIYEKDKGFYVFTRLLRYFTSSYTIYFLLCGIFIFGTIYYFLLKYAKNPFAAMSLFVLLGTFNFFNTALRQSIAIAICLWAAECLGKKKLAWTFLFALLVFIAYFFHKSSVIFIIAYPLCFLSKRNARIIVYILLSFVFVIGFSFFQDLFNELLGYGYTVEETGNGLIFLLVLAILFLYTFFTTDKNPGLLSIREDVTINLAYICLIFWVLRLISRTAERISYYFIISLYSYYSMAFTTKKEKIITMLSIIAIIMCIAFFIYRTFGTTYSFFWQV